MHHFSVHLISSSHPHSLTEPRHDFRGFKIRISIFLSENPYFFTNIQRYHRGDKCMSRIYIPDSSIDTFKCNLVGVYFHNGSRKSSVVWVIPRIFIINNARNHWDGAYQKRMHIRSYSSSFEHKTSDYYDHHSHDDIAYI